jgi:hypothetical protein
VPNCIAAGGVADRDKFVMKAVQACLQVGAIAAPLNIRLNEVAAELSLTTALGSRVKVSL